MRDNFRIWSDPFPMTFFSCEMIFVEIYSSTRNSQFYPKYFLLSVYRQISIEFGLNLYDTYA